MVYYFKISEGNMVYMGKDKHENEDLIKYAWSSDIWFHADKHSSAHIYLRLKDSETFENIPCSIIAKMCQLTKMNSIEGNKKKMIDIIYTPAKNLKKTEQMEIGSVYYYNKKNVKKIEKVLKKKELIKKMLKTKKELFPDLQMLQKKRENEILREKKNELKNCYEEKKKIEEEKRLRDLEFERQRKEFDVSDQDEDDCGSEDSDDFL